MNITSKISFGLAAVSALTGCSGNYDRDTDADQIEAALGNGSPFEVTTTSFEPKAELPDQYTCEGQPFGSSISPELSWSGAPDGTLSYAILFIDESIVKTAKQNQDYAGQNFGYHWVLWNIPASITSMPENLEAEQFPPSMGGAEQFGWNRNPYQFFGPCPSWRNLCFGEARVTDSYAFKVFALPTEHVDPVVDPSDVRFPVRQIAEYLDEIALESAKIQVSSDAKPSSFPAPFCTPPVNP